MVGALDAAADRLSAPTREAALSLLERLEAVGVIDELDDADLDRVARRAADVLASELTHAVTGMSELARRIGPVYAVEELCEHLTASGAPALTAEAVRKRVRQRTLVAFLTDDRQWAFPAWQFDPVAGQLVPNRDVIGVWQQLPHDGFLTAVDLAAWMKTKFERLPEGTPAETARRHGADHPALAQAIARVGQRAA